MAVLSEKKIKKYEELGYDIDFLLQVQPKGNLNFKPDRYFVGGDGYYTILNVYDYPTEELRNFWLLDLMQIDGTRAFLSSYRYDNKEIRKKIENSITEKETRITGNQKSTTNQEEFDEINDMKQLYREISKKNIAMLGIYIRIFVTAETLEKLFEKVENIKDKTSSFKMTILSGELDLEYKAPFIPPSKQINMINRRRGNVIPAYDLAGGYFFNHTKLEDKNGSYYGWTPTNGAVNFDFLEKSTMRTRPFMLVSGNPKMGQRTFCYKLLDDMYAKGNFIRNFDANGNYNDQTRKQYGLILSLSGRENRINPFQVFPTATNEDGTEVDEIQSFELHVEKLKNMFKMLNTDVSGDDLKVFEDVVTTFYIESNLWFANPTRHRNELRVTKIRNEDCLVLSDFITYVRAYKQKMEQNIAQQGNTFYMRSLQRILQTFSTLLTSHGQIFEGTTEFMDISNEQVVTFDLSGIRGQESIFNAQVFSALSLISADITNSGKKLKQQVKFDRSIDESTLPHYIVNIADAEYIINPKFANGVELLANMLDSMGDNYAGVIVQVNSLQGILFESNISTINDPYITAVKRIISKMQYRVFAQTSDTDIPLLANTLSGSMTESELATLSVLQKGQLFMNIAGVENIVFNQEILNSDLERYGTLN
ncbi:virulence factor [Enterococcus sp. AZ102]|uniref:virulence factor n=1 Tax=unclassified Enterococcus TaxID=2608891 RepID=UPI003F23B69E